MNENRDVFKQENALTDIDYKRKIIDEFLLTEESYQKVYDGDTHFHTERDNYWVYHNILEKKLYEEEVRIFNKLKGYGLTENHLRARNYWLFRDEHLEALEILVLERDFTIKDALLELDMLTVEEAKGVKSGLSKAEVKGKNSRQIYLLEVNCRLKKEGIAQDFFNKVTKYDVDYATSEHAILNLIEKFLKGHNLHTVKHIKAIISHIEVFLLGEIVKKGYKAVLHRFIQFGVNINRESTIYPRRSLLMDACKQKREDSVKLLLEFDADLFAKDKDGNTALMWTSSEAIARLLIEKAIKQGRLVQLLEAKNALGETALMQMCANGRKEVVELLLSYKANLFAQSNDDRTVLMYATTPELCECLIKEAENRDQLEKFIAIVDKNQRTAFGRFADAGKTDTTRYLLPLVARFSNQSELKFALSALRKAYFIYPEKAGEFDTMCVDLRKYVKPAVKETVQIENGNLKLDSNPFVVTFSVVYPFLYGEEYIAKNITNKDEAIKHVIAEIYILLQNAEEFIAYSGCLSQMFEFYYHLNYGRPFPKIDKASYEFKPFSLFYPIPNKNFKKIDKGQSLPKFLMLFLRLYGLAAEARKWVGSVPYYVANEAIKRGFFVTETDEFHAKYAHMWQLAVIVFYLCVIKKSTSLKYGVNKEYLLDLKEILAALVTLKKAPKFEHSLWVWVLDSNNYSYLTFNGPSSMNALMRFGQLKEGLACRAVSDYFISTFGESIKKHHHQVIKNPFYAHLSFDDFLEKLKDWVIEELFFANGRFNEIMANERLKNRLIESSDNKQQYAVIIKNYSIKKNEDIVQNFLEKKVIKDEEEDVSTFKQREKIANCLRLLFVSQLSASVENYKASDNYWAPD